VRQLLSQNDPAAVVVPAAVGVHALWLCRRVTLSWCFVRQLRVSSVSKRLDCLRALPFNMLVNLQPTNRLLPPLPARGARLHVCICSLPVCPRLEICDVQLLKPWKEPWALKGIRRGAFGMIIIIIMRH
jgi:hypothetical protein